MGFDSILWALRWQAGFVQEAEMTRMVVERQLSNTVEIEQARAGSQPLGESACK